MTGDRISPQLFPASLAYATFRRDESGDPVLDKVKRVRARVEKITERVINSEGNEQVAKHKVATVAAIPMDCLVWINTEDTEDLALSLRPITISSAKFPNGDQLFEVML